MNDTIVIYREPAASYADGAYKPELFVTTILHRKPFEPVHPNRAPDAAQDRTVYVGNFTREQAIEAVVEHDEWIKRCRYRHVSGARCKRHEEHDGPHLMD